jgi:Dolichyl-phosphate-mannose-protein mannosyltransferase
MVGVGGKKGRQMRSKPGLGLAAAVRAQLSRFAPGDGSRSAWIEAIATVVLVSLGLYMRLGGVAIGRTIGFWMDEANWAIRVVDKPLEAQLIRPIGFMLLTRWSVALFGKWEFAFRLLPWLAGLATPFITAFLARRFLNRPAARLLMVGILSLSPVAIDFSKEFKPYGFSLMLHLLLPLLALRWYQTRRTWDLVVCGIAAPLALFFAQDALFLYPGLFLVLGLETWRSRNFRQLGATAGFAVLSAGIVLGMYFMIWSRLPKNESDYWGKKYGVFYSPKKPSDTALGWYAGKYAEIAEFPGARRDLFDIERVRRPTLQRLKSIDKRVWLAMHLLGLAVMGLQRRYREALLFLSPALVCTAFNVLGLWPYGTFRTNLFLLAGMSAIAALGLDWKVLQKRAWAALVPVALLVLLPLAVSKNDWGATKQVPTTSSSQMAELIEQVLELPETQNIRGEPLIVDNHSFSVFRYYVRHHARAEQWRDQLDEKFDVQRRKMPQDVFKAARRLPPGQRGWLMVRYKKSPRELPPPRALRPRLMAVQNGNYVYMVQGPERKRKSGPAVSSPTAERR